MPVSWNDTTDKQMLLILLKLTSPGPYDWAQATTAMGEGYTTESLKQRFKRINAKVKEEAGDGSADVKKTPVKKAGKKAASESGSKRKAPKQTFDDAGDRDDEEKTPVKKQKIVKTEEPEEDGDEDGLLI